MAILDTIARAVLDIVKWITRPRHPGHFLLSSGVALIAIAFAAGWFFKLEFAGIFGFAVDTTNGPPAIITKGVAFLGIGLSILGALMIAIEYGQNFKRRIVLILEQRGLHDVTETPVATAVPASISGRRETVLVDIRENVVDGVITRPDIALVKVLSGISSVNLQRSGMDRSDLKMVYGGLMPVPFAFLTGMLLEEEGEVTVLDWDRFDKNWRQLDEPDDNESLIVAGLDGVPQGAPNLVLGVAVSYPINQPAVERTFGSMSFVHLRLPNVSPTSHWSKAKQNRMAKVFLNTLIQLEQRNVGQVHLG